MSLWRGMLFPKQFGKLYSILVFSLYSKSSWSTLKTYHLYSKHFCMGIHTQVTCYYYFFLIKRKDNSEKPEEISEILRTIFLGNAGFFRFWKDKEIQIAYITFTNISQSNTFKIFAVKHMNIHSNWDKQRLHISHISTSQVLQISFSDQVTKNAFNC